MAAKPIIMTITNAAKNAMLDGENLGITLRLNRLAIGGGRYNPTGNETALQSEISRHVITAGDIEPNTHTLRLFSVVRADTETEVWELGLYDTENRLFALASATDKPLFKVYPDIDFVGNFAIKLDAFDISNVQVVSDPNGALSITLMSQHLSHSNPHPQYLLRGGGVGTADDLINRIAALESRKIEPVSIGGLLVTARNYANNQEVHDGEGYGVWARFAQGQVLIGVGSHTDSNNETRNISMMQQLGTYKHQLTIDEMPSHKHDMGEHFGGNLSLSSLASATNNDERRGIDTNNPSAMLNPTGSSGGNQPHNNIQPSIGVGIWLRLPDDYIEPTYNIYWTNDAEGNNKVTEFSETDNIYLWVEASNIVGSYPISGVYVTATRHGGDTDMTPSFDSSIASPTALNDGKNLIYSKNGSMDGYLTGDASLLANITFTDIQISQQNTLSSSAYVKDTVANSDTSIPLPYHGLKFEIYIRNDGGNIKVEPKVLENNSPYIVRAGDPTTEGRQAIVITNLPLNLSHPFSYFTIEQNPINGYSGCAMGSYEPSTGTSDFLVLTQKAFDDFASGLIPDGTLINTVKLTYQP